MTQAKDYTSTLLRMAGNIAAGIAPAWRYRDSGSYNATHIAQESLAIAREILKQAEAMK